jgi:hypothetical protein
MPFKLERHAEKAIVVNTQTGKTYSKSPIPLVNAKKQLRVLQMAIEKKQEKVDG